MKKIAVILPAFNESKIIYSVIHNLSNLLTKKGYKFEIIVINDGSSDDTNLEAKKAGAKIINHIVNSGAGNATATGLSYAIKNNFGFAVTMDADGQHLPADVLRGIQIMEKGGCDLLIGSRLIENKGMSRLKILGNKGLTFITYLLFGIRITDSQSGLRIFSNKALSSLRWKTGGYEFCSEMIWRAKQSKLKIDEYPIKAVYTDYSQSKGQSNWNAINIVKSLVSIRLTEFFSE